MMNDNGAPSRNRTYNLRIKSPPLCLVELLAQECECGWPGRPYATGQSHKEERPLNGPIL